MSDAPKPRNKKLRIFITTDGAGRVVARNRAHSTIQAQAFYVGDLATREATDDEIFAIAKNDYFIGGIDPLPVVDETQAALFTGAADSTGPGYDGTGGGE